MRTAVIIGSVSIGLMSAGLLWQAQPGKRVLMTDEHPVIIDLELPPDGSAVITHGLPADSTVNVLDEKGKPTAQRAVREPMIADKEGVDPRGDITPDFERGVCYMYRVAFGIGYVTIDGKQYDCR